VLEQADHRQHQPHNPDISTCDERLSQRGDYFQRPQTARQAGTKAGDGHDEQRIDPQHEADYDYGNTD
jgi:hypothetical protein